MANWWAIKNRTQGCLLSNLFLCVFASLCSYNIRYTKAKIIQTDDKIVYTWFKRAVQHILQAFARLFSYQYGLSFYPVYRFPPTFAQMKF